jgi:hypothetical protein
VVVATAADDNDTETTTPAKQATPAKKTPSKKSPSSPKISYVQLVHEAIGGMKDRTGSSQIAIQKYIIANHPEVPADKLKQRLLHTLKAGVTHKRFIKVKASFKLHPDLKKKKKTPKKKKPVKKVPVKKELTKEQLAAIREKERQVAKEKERQDRIRKRKFPMEDLELIAEDRELKVAISLPSRPSLPVVLPEFASLCKSDTMGAGLLDDAFHVYHFFRGDVGWGKFPQNKDVVAPFTLDQWLECIQQVLRGGAKKCRMVPPLMAHLFVVALQHLVPKELQAALTPSSWSEVLMLYMDAMERYYTTEASLDAGAVPGLGIDAEYLLGATDDEKDQSLLDPPTVRESNFYLLGNLQKIQAKLYAVDPWMLPADELVSLLKVLVDDLLATQTVCADQLDDRLQESYELLKKKREADAYYRKLQNIRRKEQNEKENEEKERQENGEKPTRSNTKLATVSDAQLESSRRAQERATNAYEKASRSELVRTEAIGEDRNFHTVYHFWNDPERVYVAQRGKPVPSQTSFDIPGETEIYRTTWHSINKRSVLEKYIESLDVRGKREGALQEALQPVIKTVEDDIKAMNDKKAKLKDKIDLQRRLENAKLKCEVGRKSGRLAAQSEQEFFDLQTEIENLEKTIAGEAVETKPDLEVVTGLDMLREFDQQDEQRRRTTRRDAQKQQDEDTEEEKHPKLKCSKLWSTGNVDGTGVIGSTVWDLLELEERVEGLAKSEGDRKSWISSLETAAHSWHTASPPALEDERNASSSKASPENGSEVKKQRRESGDGSNSSSTMTAFQILTMMKVCGPFFNPAVFGLRSILTFRAFPSQQPILMLEQRVFEMSGLAVAAQDAIEADDNMSASPDDDENEEQQLQLAWKRLIHRLHRLQAKAHSKIRQLVVDAIAAARKAQQPMVVAQLREALLQFHPEAAGACKSAALEILEQHGGYDDEDDDDESDEMDEGLDESPDGPQKQQSEVGLSSVLSFEGVILKGCLDGQEDASRTDWIAAVKKCKTISKLSALAAAFCFKASEKLEKLENEQEALRDAVDAWEKASSLRKKQSKNGNLEPSEVWTHVTFTDDFCLAKVEAYPWWPAKKCIVKDEDLAKSLERLERTVVSLVGESGGLRVVTKEGLLPYSEAPPEDEDLSSHPKEIRTQLEECRAMARRIIRGKEKKGKKASKGRKSSLGFGGEMKEEKKLAS